MMTKENVLRTLEARKNGSIGTTTMAVALLENKATNLDVSAKSTHAKEVTRRECAHQATRLRTAAEVLRAAPALAAEHAKIHAQRDELLSELRAAHTIIRNALAVMSTEQKCAWGDLNERDGVAGEGVTRANERMALIQRAQGGAA